MGFVVKSGADFNLAHGIGHRYENTSQGTLFNQGQLGNGQGIVMGIGGDADFGKTTHLGQFAGIFKQKSQTHRAGGRIHNR